MDPTTTANTLSCEQPAAALRRKPMSTKGLILTGLAILNALLLVVFINRFTPAQQANAQVGRPSDYLMVPGSVTGVSTGVVFIVDTSTGQLSAVTYNDTRNSLNPLPKIDLNQVFKQGGVGAGGGGGVRPR